jgi:HK97 family phage major capsid protein
VSDGYYRVAFGDFSTHQIAEKQGLRLIRDVFTTKGSTIFHVTRRFGNT